MINMYDSTSYVREKMDLVWKLPQLELSRAG